MSIQLRSSKTTSGPPASNLRSGRIQAPVPTRWAKPKPRPCAAKRAGKTARKKTLPVVGVPVATLPSASAVPASGLSSLPAALNQPTMQPAPGPIPVVAAQPQTTAQARIPIAPPLPAVLQTQNAKAQQAQKSGKPKSPKPKQRKLSLIKMSTETGFPHTWQGPKEDRSVRFVVVPSGSEEYAMVKHAVGPRTKVVERVENPRIYEHFKLNLEEAASELSCTPKKACRVLLHGTSEYAAGQICRKGFERGFADGTAFGKGVYFSSTPDLATNYARFGGRSGRLLVCDVIVGNPVLGYSGYFPKERSVHGAVNVMPHPSIYVIFRDDFAMPRYRVSLK